MHPCCWVPHVILSRLGWEQVWLSSEEKTLQACWNPLARARQLRNMTVENELGKPLSTLPATSGTSQDFCSKASHVLHKRRLVDLQRPKCSHVSIKVWQLNTSILHIPVTNFTGWNRNYIASMSKSCFSYKALQQSSETLCIPTAISKCFDLLETMPKQQGSGFLVAADYGKPELKSPWEVTYES